jgi:cytochrome c oxidase assembly protein subunit 15
MPEPVRAFRSWRPSPTVLRRTFLGALVMNVVIVVTGGAVRLTASGLGCPTFPRCTDTSLVVTREMGAHGVIEFGNRMLTFVLTAAVGAAVVVAWRAGRRDLRGRALLLTGGIVAQALLGGVTVLTGLNPVTVMAHFLLSMLLIAVAVDAYERAAPPPADPAAPVIRRELLVGTWVLTSAVGLVLFLGTVVTGTGPHSGDKKAADRLPFDLETVSQLHADVVFLVLGLTVGLLVAARASRAPDLVRRRLAVLLGVVLAQGVVGYAQYVTDLPVFLVGVHVLGASLVWVATVRVVLAAAGTGVEAAAQSSDEPFPLLSSPLPEPELSSSEPPPPEPELSSSREKRGRPPEQVTLTSTRPSPEDSNRTRA